MFSNAKLPKSLWAEAAAIAYFLTIRSPSVALDKKTSIEVWSSTPSIYSDLKIFDCLAYLVLIMEIWNLDLLNVFFLAIRIVLKVISCGVLRPVR